MARRSGERLEYPDNPDVEKCRRCNQKHVTINGQPSCPAHITNNTETSTKGNPCRKPMGAGTQHKGVGNCASHAGNAPNNIKNAERIILETEARKILGIEGFEPIHDPFSELAKLAGEVLKFKSVLLEKVEELDSLKDYGGEGMGMQISVILSAYERALDRSSRILTDMSKLDLVARIAQLNAAIDTETATMVKRALDASLSQLSLSPEDREKVLRDFGNNLRYADENTYRPAIPENVIIPARLPHPEQQRLARELGARRVECNDCDMAGHPGGMGNHFKNSGHTKKIIPTPTPDIIDTEAWEDDDDD